MRTHVSARGAELTVAALRALVAGLVALHVVLVATDLRAAALLAPAIVATLLVVGSAAAGYLAPRRPHGRRGRRAVTATLAAVDALALVAIARITVEIDPTASIVWAFVLWVPFSIAVRTSLRVALVGTLAVAALVLLANVVAPGGLTPIDLAWTTVAVPTLLVLVGGTTMSAAALAHRRGDAVVQRQLQDEQYRSSRLREADELKNTFLAAVSHELRSPLTSILGFALTLLDRPELDDAQRERMLRTIVLEAEHLEDILANLLDLDRLTRGKASLVAVELDPARVVAGAVDHVRRRSGRAIDVDVQEGQRVWLDAAKVERIVENLVGNAVKYTPADAEIRVTMQRDRAGVRIRVDDAGPGIGPELREKIFEPFRRGADHGVPGTGIGLSLVDRFSRMHGGTAWLEERPGGGCRFQVYLPSAQDRASGGDAGGHHVRGATVLPGEPVELPAATSSS